MTLHDTAKSYLAAGLCVLPAIRAEKRPALSQWKPYRNRLPSQAELDGWLASEPDAICVVCGQVSGHLEVLDFDAGGESYQAWRERIPQELHSRLIIQSTPSGGCHVIYRCQSSVCGNLKLAQRRIDQRTITLIETRGEGGLFLCAPTPGYEMIQGDLCSLPVLTDNERDTLLMAAWELNEYVPPAIGESRCAHDSPVATPGCPAPTPGSHTLRPGDDFNQRGDVRAVLGEAGWSLAKPGDNEYWRRPGKTFGWSATLRDRVFYVFSANAAPFEPSRAYSPFAVFTLLNCGGDYEAAAQALRASGFGCDCHLDVSQSHDDETEQVEPVPELPDPGPTPAQLLRIPGFVSELMDHCLATAPYPNQVMAFCGALALQAFLAARKVRDSGDNRTNLYLLGLAHSAAGKDWPRKINTRIVHEIGLANCLGERFASGEGIQDALFQTPAMLFQTDEIDGMLQSINKARDARHEAIMDTLLTMYSSANSVYPMRRKAGKEPPGVINQPGLVIFGTAIPNHYYEALSERMLTNGFFARMIILESGPRSCGQEPIISDPPPRVLATARWWADYRPGTGNLENWHPVAQIIGFTREAALELVEVRQEADCKYTQAESRGDAVGTTVWGRVSEQVRKLSLLYAISQNHLNPCIGRDAVRWASAFVMHQTRRMLFMAAGHVAENPFHAECLKMMEKLRAAPGGELPHSVLLKRMKMDARHFNELVTTLSEQGDIRFRALPQQGRGGRPVLMYQLARQGTPS